jgi:hypothetical protein
MVRLGIFAIAVVLALAFFFLTKPGRALWRKPTRRRVDRCPRCHAGVTSVGFISWNGGASGDLNLLKAGGAKPSESFIEELREAARGAPKDSARLVGSLGLYRCEGCDARFVEENKSGTLEPCTRGKWMRLTS